MKRISVILCLWTLLLLPVAVAAQESLWDVFTAKAREAYEKKSYDEAAMFYQEAMKAAEAIGPDDPRLASTCNNLAEVFRIQKKYAEAERLYRRALVIREKHLGKEHEDVALIINNLAVLYAEQGRNDMAELLYKRAIEIAEKRYKGHLAATIYINLAELHREQKNYAAAKQHYHEALSIQVATKDAGAVQTLVDLLKMDELLDDVDDLPQRWQQVSSLPVKARLPAQLMEVYRRINGLWMKHRQGLSYEQNAAVIEGFATAVQELEAELGSRRAEVLQLRQMSQEARHWLQQQRRDAANSEPMTPERSNQRPPHASE